MRVLILKSNMTYIAAIIVSILKTGVYCARLICVGDIK